MRVLMLVLVGLVLGCGERETPVSPSGKASGDSLFDLFKSGGSAIVGVDSTAVETPADSTAVAEEEEVVADTVETEEEDTVETEEEEVVAPVDSTVVAPDPIDRTQIADPFNIQIEYRHRGGPVFTAEDKAAIERAARRWEEVIVEGFADTTAKVWVREVEIPISEFTANFETYYDDDDGSPGFRLNQTVADDLPWQGILNNNTWIECEGLGCNGGWFDCSTSRIDGTTQCEASEGTVWRVLRQEYEQGYVDDFYLVAGAWKTSVDVWGRAIPTAERGRESEIPLSGEVDFFRRTAEIGADEMYWLALHEIGHTLGLVGVGVEGVGVEGVAVKKAGTPDYWLRPAFVSRFGVTEGVFGLIGGHFNLPGDVMSGSPYVTSLSAAVLDDMGYTVDYGAVEEWRPPWGKLSVLAEHNLHLRCGVGH